MPITSLTSEVPTHNAKCSETPTLVPSASPTMEPSTGFQTQPPSTTSSSQLCGTSGPTSHTDRSWPPTSVPNSSQDPSSLRATSNHMFTLSPTRLTTSPTHSPSTDAVSTGVRSRSSHRPPSTPIQRI